MIIRWAGTSSHNSLGGQQHRLIAELMLSPLGISPVLWAKTEMPWPTVSAFQEIQRWLDWLALAHSQEFGENIELADRPCCKDIDQAGFDMILN
jgi:hypothetical protein